MPKSISLNAAEIDCLFCLTHTLYIANTLSSLLSPSFEPKMRVLAGRLNALLKVRDTEAITLARCDERKWLHRYLGFLWAAFTEEGGGIHVIGV